MLPRNFINKAILIFSASTVLLFLLLTLFFQMNYGIFYSKEKRQEKAKLFYSKATISLESDLKKAEKLFLKAYRFDKNNYSYLWQLAVTRGQLGKTKKAINDYENLKLALPDKPLVFMQLAGLYIEDGNFENAKSNYKQALKLDPKNEKIYYELAVFFRKQNNNIEAKRILEEGLGMVTDSTLLAELLRKL
jgi:Tfp pilus assembly protein PilF